MAVPFLVRTCGLTTLLKLDYLGITNTEEAYLGRHCYVEQHAKGELSCSPHYDSATNLEFVCKRARALLLIRLSLSSKNVLHNLVHRF